MLLVFLLITFMRKNIKTEQLGNGIVVTKIFDDNNKLHCDDCPAIVTQNSEEWYKHGLKHKINGYAVKIIKDDWIRLEWWKDGVLHRDGDKPAVIDSNGIMEWWIEGELKKNSQ